MAAPMEKPFPRLKLPNELITLVAEHADPETTCSLRLVSRKVCDCTEEAFLSKHFSERCFMLAIEDSSKYLLKIAKNTKYAKHVRRLWFDTSSPSDKHPPDGKSAEDYIKYHLKILPHRLTTAFRAIDQAVSQSVEIRWVMSEVQHKTGWTASCSFRTANADPFGDLSYSPTNALLQSHQAVPLATLKCERVYSGVYMDHGVVLRALQHARLPPSVLDLGELSRPFGFKDLSLRQMLRVQCLRELRLYIRPEIEFEDNDGPEVEDEAIKQQQARDRLAMFVQTLWAAVNLQSLYFSTVDPDYYGYPDEPGELLHCLLTGTIRDGQSLSLDRKIGLWPVLKTLAVSDSLGPHIQALLDFVASRSATLKDVKLRSWHEHDQRQNR